MPYTLILSNVQRLILFFVYVEILIMASQAFSITLIFEPRVRKPTNCLCKNKDADQLCSNCTADRHIFFATQIIKSLFFVNPKFQASSLLL